MREPTPHTSPFGWTATSDTAGTTVSLHDPRGQLRATWPQQEREAKLHIIRLRPNHQHRVTLHEGASPAGEATLDNGRPRPVRRRDHNGSLTLHGRTLAAGHRGSFGRHTLDRAQPLDPTDELALALFWFAITPGRPGMIWMTFESV
ncbi:hypothetical protein [Streptomyces sp. NPDC058045]|uniref:hypothetical protein n=1 Tax=Streptomyces sp. NPDC058045 TaxID=3346311 RepID=UPI0036EFEEB3